MEQKHECLQISLEGSEFLYSAPDSQKFALIPEIFSKYRPATIAFSDNLHYMRVGASLFSNNSTEMSTYFKVTLLETDDLVAYWEEIACRDSLVAFARRRAPRQESRYIDAPKIVDLENEISGINPIEDLDEDVDVLSSDCGPMNAEVQSLYSESSYGGNQSQVEAAVTLSDTENSSIRCALDSFSDSDISKGSDSCISFSDDGSNYDNLERYSSTAGSVGTTSGSDNEHLPQGDPFEYEKEPLRYCNVCGNSVGVHYKCHLCTEYDLCESCFDDGKWCLDAHHLLTKKMYSGQQGGETACHKDLALVEELMILDTRLPEPRELYRFRQRSEVLMFDSPPVFHPTAPLVVWLMSRNKLLIGNFEAKSPYIHRVPAPRSKSRLRFGTELESLHC